MKQKMALLFSLVALVLTACSSDPQWADPEAHEKTVSWPGHGIMRKSESGSVTSSG